MQSSYQYHFGAQAAAAKGASPTKGSPTKAAPAQANSGAASTMFQNKVDWGATGGSSANGKAQGSQAASHVPYGFGGGSVGFGGGPSFGGGSSSGPGAAASFGGAGASFGAPASKPIGIAELGIGSKPQASFGGPIGAAKTSAPNASLGLGSSHSSRAAAVQVGAIASNPSFGGPSAAAAFGGPAANDFQRQSASSMSFGGMGSSTSSWQTANIGEHVTTCKSVKEYAYHEDRNQRFRPQMEDTHCIIDKVVPNDPSLGLFCIFDGHGGRQVSDYAAERFPIEMRKELMKNPADLSNCITEVYTKINQELRLLDSDGCGSTACTAIVRKEGSANVVYVANVGDTRAVLSKSGQAERLSIDDKCDNPAENLRVKSGGGLILDNRLGGVLAVTRALGDHALTKTGLIATPHINKYTIKPLDKYLVIASDGVWDELSDQDAIDLCHDDIDTKRIAQMIVRTSLQRGSKDNISVIVLKFNGNTGASF